MSDEASKERTTMIIGPGQCMRIMSRKGYCEQLMQGHFRMSLISRYHSMEEDDPEIGDSQEGRRPFAGQIFLGLPSSGSNDGAASEQFWPVESTSTPVSIPEADEAVVLCGTLFGSGALDTWNETGRHFGKLSDSYTGFLSTQAGAPGCCYGVLFSIEEMAERLSAFAEQNGLAFYHRAVEYSDEPLTTADFARFSTGEDAALWRILFHKRSIYRNQHEYRFAILPKPGDRSGKLKSMLCRKDYLEVSVPPLKSYKLIEVCDLA